jgi:hypothetical protein
MPCGNRTTLELCTVFDQSHVCPACRRLSDCAGCSVDGQPRIVQLVLLLLGLVGFVTAVVVGVRRAHHLLVRAATFNHLKSLVSFVTVVAAVVDSELEIRWPKPFSDVLNWLSMISLDLGVTSSMLCLPEVNLHADVLYSLLGLLFVVVAIVVASTFTSDSHKIRYRMVWLAVHIPIFAFPQLATKLFKVFSCREDSTGTLYLAADCSIECFNTKYYAFAVLSAASIVSYVIGFPVWVFAKVFYGSCAKSELVVALVEDYRDEMPAKVWESIDLTRKLLLAAVGASWTAGEKPVAAVAVALLINVTFQFLHSYTQPCLRWAGNAVQQGLMATLSLILLAGLLVKVDNASKFTEVNTKSLGIVLGLLVAGVFAGVVGGIGVVVVTVVRRRELHKRQVSE